MFIRSVLFALFNRKWHNTPLKPRFDISYILFFARDLHLEVQDIYVLQKSNRNTLKIVAHIEHVNGLKIAMFY